MDHAYGREEHARAIERRKSVEQKLEYDVREMVEVLRVDVPKFFEREVKRRFAAWPEAERLTDEAVKKLKQDTASAGEHVAAELATELTPLAAWAWDPQRPFPEDPKGLEANPRVATVLRSIGDELAALLERHGLPEHETAKDSYKLPSYFVAGRFMKSLVESYWRGLLEYVELSRLIEEVGSRERRERQQARWDGA